MKQESKLTWATIYVKQAIHLAELKDAFALESRQNLCMEKYFVFIQKNTYTTIDFYLFIVDPKIQPPLLLFSMAK